MVTNAEFAANDGTSKSTQCTPLFALEGINSQMIVEREPTQQCDQRILDADQVQATMPRVHERLRGDMGRRQALQDQRANQGRIPVGNIDVGFKVGLDARNIRTMRPT